MIINKQKKCYDELQIENTFAHAQICPTSNMLLVPTNQMLAFQSKTEKKSSYC